MKRRSRLDGGVKALETIFARVPPLEGALIRGAAGTQGQTLSEYVRQACREKARLVAVEAQTDVWAQIVAAAEDRGETVSDFIVTAALHRALKSV